MVLSAVLGTLSPLWGCGAGSSDPSAAPVAGPTLTNVPAAHAAPEWVYLTAEEAKISDEVRAARQAVAFIAAMLAAESDEVAPMRQQEVPTGFDRVPVEVPCTDVEWPKDSPAVLPRIFGASTRYSVAFERRDGDGTFDLSVYSDTNCDGVANVYQMRGSISADGLRLARGVWTTTISYRATEP